MIRIFLVEDESFALKALSHKIADLHDDYEVIGSANDGKEALGKIRELNPDVVITDIRMADMDGLELIKHMRAENISAIPVIISGYQEFEYAKTAVQLGVEDYLVKPVDIQELEATLKKCRERVNQKAQGQSIYSILIGKERFNLDSYFMTQRFMLVYMVFANPLTNSDSLLHPGTGYLPSSEVLAVFKEVLNDSHLFFFEGSYSNEKAILLSVTGSIAKNPAVILSEVMGKLFARFTFPVTLFYKESSAKSLNYDIQSVRQKCINSAVIGLNGCYDTVPTKEISFQEVLDVTDTLTPLLQQENYPVLENTLATCFSHWQKEYLPLLRMEAHLVFILNSLKEKTMFTREGNFDAQFFIENIFCFSYSVAELTENYLQLLKELMPDFARAEQPEPLVAKIEAYLRAHITSNVSLQMLADEMNVSKVYLSRLFKREKNATPIDYFNRLKIEKAVELMRQFPDHSLQEISEILGFNDVYYFGKVFKRIKGDSPAAYKKSHLQADDDKK